MRPIFSQLGNVTVVVVRTDAGPLMRAAYLLNASSFSSSSSASTLLRLDDAEVWPPFKRPRSFFIFFLPVIAIFALCVGVSW